MQALGTVRALDGEARAGKAVVVAGGAEDGVGGGWDVDGIGLRRPENNAEVTGLEVLDGDRAGLGRDEEIAASIRVRRERVLQVEVIDGFLPQAGGNPLSRPDDVAIDSDTAIPIRIGDDVRTVTRSEAIRVVAGTSCKGVMANATIQDVVVGATFQLVVLASARQRVVALAAAQGVDATVALDRVIVELALDGVVAGVAVEVVRPVAAEDLVVVATTVNRVFPATALHHVVATCGVDLVVAFHAVQAISGEQFAAGDHLADLRPKDNLCLARGGL